jgi:gliding motility associated protien GldN
MQMKKLMTLIVLSTLVFTTKAQSNLEYWPYEKHSIQERKVVKHRYTSEASVKYHKRIHRVIDLRQKQNKPMVWPKSSIVEILHTAALRGPNRDGGIDVYETDELGNGHKFTLQEAAALGVDTFVVPTIDTTGGDDEQIVNIEVPVPLDLRSITKLKIMEDWIFDHKYSDFRVRIVAIAPMYQVTASGIELGEQPLFWAKMDDATRLLLANSEVFNRYNDARNLSFDDWFEQRLFSSYIVEESNVFDTAIAHQEEFEDDGLLQLLESDRIKNDLFVLEHDLWEY